MEPGQVPPPRERAVLGSLAREKYAKASSSQDIRGLVHSSPHGVNPAAQPRQVDEGRSHISQCGINSQPNGTDTDIASTLTVFFSDFIMS